MQPGIRLAVIQDSSLVDVVYTPSWGKLTHRGTHCPYVQFSSRNEISSQPYWGAQNAYTPTLLKSLIEGSENQKINIQAVYNAGS